MSVWFWILFGAALVASLVVVYIIIKCADVTGDPGPLTEQQFWANKCHEAFNEAQRAYGLEDLYSFHKFCDQHALYYRRYQMARDGHFERKAE